MQGATAANNVRDDGVSLDADMSNDEREIQRLRSHPAMQITEEERTWALAIKSAAEEDPDLLGLSDFEYLQYAIVTQGNVDDSLRRMRGLQLFRQEYGINETFEQGVDMIQALLMQQPGLVLSVDKAKTSPHHFQPHLINDPEAQQLAELNSHYMMVFDFAKINPKNMRLPRDKREMLGGVYYIHNATQTTPNAIRNGILFIAECEGMSFDNVSLDFVGPIWTEMKVHYPVYLKEISWLRAATAATVLYALCKPFFPRDYQRRVNLGCEFQAFEGRLDELFFTQPTEEQNAMWILQRAETHLRERFQTTRIFRL